MTATDGKRPVLDAYVASDGINTIVWCDHCGTHHYHGHACSQVGPDCVRITRPDGTWITTRDCGCPVGTGDGHRAAHCGDPESPYARTGYIIREVRRLEPGEAPPKPDGFCGYCHPAARRRRYGGAKSDLRAFHCAECGRHLGANQSHRLIAPPGATLGQGPTKDLFGVAAGWPVLCARCLTPPNGSKTLHHRYYPDCEVSGHDMYDHPSYTATRAAAAILAGAWNPRTRRTA